MGSRILSKGVVGLKRKPEATNSRNATPVLLFWATILSRRHAVPRSAAGATLKTAGGKLAKNRQAIGMQVSILNLTGRDE
jgi:hypothetical protein